jgi:hypothetical protein
VNETIDEAQILRENFWKHLGAIHPKKDGTIAAVWVALDEMADVAHLYDATIFERELLIVVAEGIKARGKWVPVVCLDEEISDALYERGCNMLETEKETEVMAELSTLEVLERIRTGRFKAKSHLTNWIEEFKTYNREDSRVPRDTHPLMSATRIALAHLDDAKAKSSGVKRNNFKEVAIV